MKKWLKDIEPNKLNPKGVKYPQWKKALLRAGLEVVDHAGTPVIVRTPWKLKQNP